MMPNQNPYLKSFKHTLHLCSDEKWLSITLLIVATLAALSEGISLAMLVPLLQLNTPEPYLQKVPFVGPFVVSFAGMPRDALICWVVGFMAGVIALRGLLQFWSGCLSSKLPIRIKLRLSRRVYASLLKSSVPFVERQDIGSLSAYVEDHPSRVASAVRALIEVIFNAGLIIVYGLLMLAISWQMTLLSGAFVTLLGFTAKIVLINPLDKIGLGLSTAQAKLHNVFFDTIHALRLIHLGNAELRMQTSFDKAAIDYYRSDLHRMVVASGQSPIMMTGAGLFICGTIIIFAQFTPSSDTSWLAGVLVFMLAFYRMLTPATAINNSLAVVLSNFHSFSVLREFIIDSERHCPVSGSRPFMGLKHAIVFDKVCLSYPDSTEKSLSNLSFEIPHNRMVALVGPSGAGKSSIVSLLVRFYEPTSGRILLDDHPLDSFDMREWRRRVGVVGQQAILLNDTVRSNVCFGLDNVSNDDLHRALKLSASDEFVDALPQGIETVLGDKGARLSGGQQQRLSIARVLLQDPDVLVLDEATSHLDSLTERVIQQTLALLRGSKTILVVAHRLATIQSADTIVVIDRGRVVEQGSHVALYNQSGLYRSMIEEQIVDLQPHANRMKV